LAPAKLEVIMQYEVVYRIKGYALADALRPDPFWGKRIFRVDTEKLGTEDEDEIRKAAIATAPEGYDFHTMKVLLGTIPKDHPRYLAEQGIRQDTHGLKSQESCRMEQAMCDTKKKPGKLSSSMLDVLHSVHRGLGTHGTARGRSQHGGRFATVIALRQRGLLIVDDLTDAGREALKAAGLIPT
jgi:hypothetical protein